MSWKILSLKKKANKTNLDWEMLLGLEVNHFHEPSLTIEWKIFKLTTRVDGVFI